MKKKLTNESELPGFHPQIITNARGKKIGAFFEIDEYQKLVRAFEDLCLGSIATLIKKREAGKDRVSLKALKEEVSKKRPHKKS